MKNERLLVYPRGKKYDEIMNHTCANISAESPLHQVRDVQGWVGVILLFQYKKELEPERNI